METRNSNQPPLNKPSMGLAVVLISIIVVIFFGSRFYVTVPAGHVAVATLFGKVNPSAFDEGMHIPVNPLYSWHFYDARQKTEMETASVPSQDQLQTKIDVSVQFRLNAQMAPSILGETGTFYDLVNVHLLPKLRSLMREQGKTIERAEDFFQEATQEMLQTAIFSELRDYLAPKGLELQAVLIRDINLPPFIAKAIESKKEREQEVEKQKAELERFRAEQEQKIVQAQAEKLASESEAEKRRIIADIQAYEITKVNDAIANNKAYIQLKAMDALKDISKNPSNQIYFLNSDSPNPLPLMHIGDNMKVKG